MHECSMYYLINRIDKMIHVQIEQQFGSVQFSQLIKFIVGKWEFIESLF